MLKVAPLFTDRCVLPMGKELRVFGEADGPVEVSLRSQDAHLLSRAEAEPVNGRFLALLPAVDSAATRCTLCVRCRDEELTAGDVAIGLVFLAGGQSNMELELQNADEGRSLIQAHADDELRYYNVPKRALWDEEAVQAESRCRWERIAPGTALDMSAVAYFFARRVRRETGLPVGVIDCYWGGTSITCWMDEEALSRISEGRRYQAIWQEQCGGKSMAQFKAEWAAFEQEMADWNERCAALRAQNPAISWDELTARAGLCPWHPPVGPGSPYRPAGLCETMLKRVAPAALSAMLFYQGEEDAARTDCYEQLLMQMTLRWRELFMDMELPFINMQLCMWIDSGAEDDGSWARLRMAQQRAQRQIANSALCCIIDCGEKDNIHPTDKRTPGERMADVWLDHTGIRKTPGCPRALRKATEGHTLRVTCSAPLTLRGGEAELFEVAGADGVYHAAKAELCGNGIVLSSTAVARPVMARYAYVAYAKVHVYGENGLPLMPFDLK